MNDIYNKISNKYVETLKPIDDMYVFLITDNEIKRLQKEDNTDALETLNYDNYLKLKRNNVTLVDLENIVQEKQNTIHKEHNKLNDLLNNVNLCELDTLHMNLKQNKRDKWSHFINKIKLNDWWNKVDIGDQGELLEDYIVNVNIEEYINFLLNKLIIYDIKKNVFDANRYSLDSLYNCCQMLHSEFIDNNIIDTVPSFVDINKKNVCKYLLSNEKLYELDNNYENLVINTLDSNVDTYKGLDQLFNILSYMKGFIKKEYDAHKTIPMNYDVNHQLKQFNYTMSDLLQNSGSLYLNEQIEPITTLDNIDGNGLKDRCHLYLKKMNKNVYDVYNFYLNSIIDNDTFCYECLQDKYIQLENY